MFFCVPEVPEFCVGRIVYGKTETVRTMAITEATVVVVLFGSIPVYTDGCIQIAEVLRAANAKQTAGVSWKLVVCHDSSVPAKVLQELKRLGAGLKDCTGTPGADGERRTFWRYPELEQHACCIVVDADEPDATMALGIKILRLLQKTPQKAAVVGFERNYKYGDEDGMLWMGGMLGAKNLQTAGLNIQKQTLQYLASAKSRKVLHDNGLNKASKQRYANGYGHDELLLTEVLDSAKDAGVCVLQVKKTQVK